jgi:hypothetical protein
MIKTLLICAVVSASAVACSTTAPPKTASADTAPPPCLQDSASRIPRRSGECSGAPGRSYSNQDIERTGHTSVGEALQNLDPSITVHH